jgi:putative component of toxin-antitoxin plasmid stabilization module
MRGDRLLLLLLLLLLLAGGDKSSQVKDIAKAIRLNRSYRE